MNADETGAERFRQLLATLKALRATHKYAEAHPHDLALHERRRANLRAFRADVQRWRREVVMDRPIASKRTRGVLARSKETVERSRRMLASVTIRAYAAACWGLGQRSRRSRRYSGSTPSVSMRSATSSARRYPVAVGCAVRVSVMAV